MNNQMMGNNGLNNIGSNQNNGNTNRNNRATNEIKNNNTLASTEVNTNTVQGLAGGQVRQGLAGVNTNINRNGPARVQNGASTTLSKKLPKQAANNPKYTENWINVKNISNGIIYNNNNEMVSGVKINPKNIFILDQSEMDNTLIGLMNFYNTLDFEFWLVVADRPVDIAMYQAELQLLYNKTPDQRIRKLISQDMDKGDYFVNNSVVDTEYYLLFKEKRADMVSKKVRSLINGLAGAGLVASQTSNDDLRMIIDNFLNGGRKFESGTVMPQ